MIKLFDLSVGEFVRSRGLKQTRAAVSALGQDFGKQQGRKHTCICNDSPGTGVVELVGVEYVNGFVEDLQGADHEFVHCWKGFECDGGVGFDRPH